MGSPSAAPPPPQIELPVWTRVLGWLSVVGLIYLLICAVGIISRGFRGLGGDAATINDFYNLLSLFIFFPIELAWHPLERISGGHGQRALRRRMAARPEPVQLRQRRH
jgi:hypothetical protein